MKILKCSLFFLFLAVAAPFAAEWTGARTEPTITKTIDGKKYYVIAKAEELAWFAYQVNSGNNEINGFLNNDIVFGTSSQDTCSFKWTPIGKDSTSMFGGIFDGNNKVIYGLNPLLGKFTGLFGVTNENAELKKFTIGKSSRISAVSQDSKLTYVYAGSVVAINNGRISNVINQGFVDIYSLFKDSTNSVNSYNYLSGIAAVNYGIITHASNQSVISNSQNITNTKYGSYNANASSYVGGIAAYNLGTIQLSTNNDSLYATAHVYDCRYSSIHSMAWIHIGGIAGGNAGFINDCINLGKIKTNNSTSKESNYYYVYVGGVAGSSNENLKNSFSVASSIEGSVNDIQGVSTKATNCFYDISLLPNIGGSSFEGIVGISTENMQTDELAWILNTTYGNESNRGVWSRYDGYPVFANDTLLPIHKIVFDDGENTTIFYTNYKGLVPEFPGVPQAPEGKAFAGWVDAGGNTCDLTTVFTEDQTITASFLDWEDVLYTVQFLDEKGKLLDKTTVHSGETPTYSGDEPVKQENAAYTYAFAKWRACEKKSVN